MKEFKLKDNENAYDIIDKYIRRYWERKGHDTNVIVFLATSYNGEEYYEFKELVFMTPFGDEIMYDTDWWEGEKYIRLYGIQAIEDVEIVGGIYED